MKPPFRFDFDEIVTIVTDDPEYAEVNGERGVILGRTEDPDDAEYGVFVYREECVWQVPEAHLAPTGEREIREPATTILKVRVDAHGRGTLLALFFALLAGLGCGPKPPARVVTPEVAARIDSTLARFVVDGRVAGVSAVVWEKGAEAYFGAYGYADREMGALMARNTIVQIWSMTKPLTGVALMTLYEQGAFDLDDPVAKYAPEWGDLTAYAGDDATGAPIFEPLERPLTIRDLTRHTAGLTNDQNAPGIGPLLRAADPMNRSNTLEEMSRRLASVPLLHQPGARWNYGPAVDVQAWLVERISGMPFEQYLAEHVLGPLGMTRTRYFVPVEERHRLAATYVRDQGPDLVRAPDSLAWAFNTQDWPLRSGGWGLTATIDDYLRFARMLLGRGELEGVRILKPETVDLMATNQLDDAVTDRMWLPSKGQVGFGIDFAVRVRPPASPEEANGAVGEFFWDGAASTLFWVDPANDLTAVFFVQLMPFDGVGLHKGFRDAVYGAVR